MKKFFVFAALVIAVISIAAAPSGYNASVKLAADRISQAYDDVAGCVYTIPFEHHELHEGDAFHAHYSVTTASSDDDVTAIGFTTPNTTKWSHMVVTVSASDPAELIINEAPTIGTATAGTQGTAYNRNRNSSSTPTLVSLESPAVAGFSTFTEAQWTTATVSAGTELDHVYLAGGSGPNAIGGVSRGTEEYILKQNTTYLIYLQNTGANANTHSIHLEWYEHTNSN